MNTERIQKLQKELCESAVITRARRDRMIESWGTYTINDLLSIGRPKMLRMLDEARLHTALDRDILRLRSSNKEAFIKKIIGVISCFLFKNY